MKIIIEVSTCRMSMNPEEGLRLFRASSLRVVALVVEAPHVRGIICINCKANNYVVDMHKLCQVGERKGSAPLGSRH